MPPTSGEMDNRMDNLMDGIMEITAIKNSKIQHTVKLKHRDYRYEHGQFLIEGDKLLTEAVKSGITVLDVFLTKTASHLSTMFDLEDKSYTVPDYIMDKISGQKSSSGVVAICEIPAPVDVEAFFNGDKYILLDNISDPANLGTVIRSAEAFGISGVVISSDSTDLYSLKTLRGSMGSVFRLPLLSCDNLSEICNLLHSKEIALYAAAVADGGISLRNVDFCKPSAVIIGNESFGIDSSLIALCDSTLAIPMSGMTESLNAGVAASVIMYAMAEHEIA